MSTGNDSGARSQITNAVPPIPIEEVPSSISTVDEGRTSGRTALGRTRAWFGGLPIQWKVAGYSSIVAVALAISGAVVNVTKDELRQVLGLEVKPVMQDVRPAPEIPAFVTFTLQIEPDMIGDYYHDASFYVGREVKAKISDKRDSIVPHSSQVTVPRSANGMYQCKFIYSRYPYSGGAHTAVWSALRRREMRINDGDVLQVMHVYPRSISGQSLEAVLLNVTAGESLSDALGDRIER